ncbi:hypothetical protein POSPLADRAFT_1137618 [Postia placenta MAD-698-R-SB12]|uniref:Uncharacterized protein n=1 Tax=Postia placenta MAD-698-R-SB12 TaxID=670580 RepID=A0A1X6N7U2_9APHY|nr:hypothetical protein POSPLADRAFT_1137618 [Postia placenta MAD-698-R-SB12]OSX64463.1 hypothetical protein POSPLADRAFT_1137618 [Postia placenta MAD-698-R-SB12]
MAALMLAEAACIEGAPPRAPPRPRPRAEKKLFSSGLRARLISRICSTSVARFSAACHVVKVSSSIFRYTQEGMLLRYLSRSSRSPYPERSTGPLNSVENSAAAAVKAASFLQGVVTPCTPICTDASWANDSCHHIEVGGGASGSLCQGRSWWETLSAPGGTEDAAGAEAAVVALRWSNFERSECSSGLSAESAVKAPEKVRRGVWREISSYLTGFGNSLGKAGAGGDRARVLRGGSRCKGASRTERMLHSSDCLVAGVIFCDRLGCPVGARLLLATVDDSLRAVWDVDVDEVLRVECVNLALAGSHVGWGEEGEEPSPHIRNDKHRPLKCSGGDVCMLSMYRRGQEVETEIPRAAEASLYTWGDKGRLCALVRAQLVHAQHADAAPGAGESEQLCQRNLSCAVHCCPN